jgi:hypothetical protein
MSKNQHDVTRLQNLAREISTARDLARSAYEDLDRAHRDFNFAERKLKTEFDHHCGSERDAVGGARSARRNLSKALKRLTKIRDTIEQVGRESGAHPYGELSARMPRRGERLLIAARGSDMSPMHDHTGGEVTIAGWEMETSAGEQVPFVWFVGFPEGYMRNYRALLAEQANLSGYRGQVARPDPDYKRVFRPKLETKVRREDFERVDLESRSADFDSLK